MNKNNIIIYIVFCFLFFSCGGSDPDIEPNPTAPSITISVAPTSISFPVIGGEQILTVTTNAESWTVTTTEKWLTATKDGNKVKLIAEANFLEARSATVTCNVQGKEVKASVNVAQDKGTKEEKQRIALNDLATSLGVDWNLNENLDKWEGVTIEDQQIVALDLASKNLKGSIPSSIGQLTDLRHLDISENTIEGGIPAEINNLINLEYFDISNNKLSGNIPSLNSLTKLIVFDCSSNEFTSMPALPSISDIEYIALSDNKLSGDLATNLANYTNLIYLDLSNNKFSGIIPNEWASFEKIRALHLYNNVLSGNIPNYLTQFGNLKSLALNHNNLEGEIPLNLGSLLKLEDLYLMQNKLTGKIPNSLSNNLHWNIWLEYVYPQQEGYGFVDISNLITVKQTRSKTISLAKYYKAKYRK